MKKMKILLLFLLFGHCGSAEDYRTIQKSDGGRNFVFSIIKDGDKEIAKFCLVDPEPFYFFSVESDKDMFPDIEKNIQALSKRKNRGQPIAAILADFNHQPKVKKSFSIKYLVNYFGILLFAPPYIKKISILNPDKFSRRFFVETKIEGRDYYGAIVIDTPLTVNSVKILLKNVRNVGDIGIITPILDNFPIKLVSFSEKMPIIIYESEKNHKEYSCIFLAGTNK